MIGTVAFGFVAIVVLAFAVSAMAGRRWRSVVLATLAGVASLMIGFAAYVALLALWARSWLIDFINTELPMLIDRLTQFVDRFPNLKELL